MAIVTEDSSDASVSAYIDDVYRRGPWRLGWTYIYGQPESRRNPRIVTIGLNPGGGRDDRKWGDDAHLDQRHTPKIRNAYFDQPWGPGNTLTPLQRQLARLGDLNPDVPPNEWLSFQFVPFRSPGWAELADKKVAIALGTELLPWTLALAKPELIVGFGLAPIAKHLTAFLDAKLIESPLTGWGDIRAQVYSLPTSGRLVLLPHLSRYRVLGRGSFLDEKRLLSVDG